VTNVNVEKVSGEANNSKPAAAKKKKRRFAPPDMQASRFSDVYALTGEELGKGVPLA
jgi:hypothetical protein